MADALVGLAKLQRWRQTLPEVSVDEWPNVGHFVAEEAPEAVEAAVRAVWTETD